MPFCAATSGIPCQFQASHSRTHGNNAFSFIFADDRVNYLHCSRGNYQTALQDDTDFLQKKSERIDRISKKNAYLCKTDFSAMATTIINQ